MNTGIIRIKPAKSISNVKLGTTWKFVEIIMDTNQNQFEDFYNSHFKNKKQFRRLLTSLENNDEKISKNIWNYQYKTKDPLVIGITGPSGSGKSSLINELVKHLRDNGFKERIALILVDPSSPISGGALLGDRIRMKDLFLDEDIFIRSLSTRGHLGGLTSSIMNILRAMMLWVGDSGFIFIETTGSGQTDVKISQIADSIILNLNPESGDDIQAIKAGILEIADLYVINKSDLANANVLYENLLQLLEINTQKKPDDWEPNIIKASVKTGENIQKIIEILFDHKQWLKDHNLFSNTKKKRITLHLKLFFEEKILSRLQEIFNKPEIEKIVENITNGNYNLEKGISEIKNINKFLE